MRRLFLATALIIAGSAAAGPTGAQTPARLGTVTFKVECNATAQKDFNHAMALYHSFDWPASAAAFAYVAVVDPACGMAHWGQAMTILGNPFVWPTGLTPEKLNLAAASLADAKKAGLANQRERDYVDALAVFLREHERQPHAARLQAFDAAMADLAARYSSDTEAAILSALITSANFDPMDKGYANQKKAAQKLEPLFQSQPDHPGVAHYLIHSYDYPPLAKSGLEAAKKYASIAPDAPHALHMPSHIFTRLGLWRESIAANAHSARVAGDTTFDRHHAADYMVYGHLQLAQDRAARDVVTQSLGLRQIDNFAAAYAYAAMPARLALESGDWAAAARLALRPAGGYPWKKYPHAEAVNAFARGVGAARSGDATVAGEQHRRLLALGDAAREAKLAYWVEQIDIQAALVNALALCAMGKAADCITGLRKAADREDATEKHVVTPGPLVPARELLAEMLLAQKKPFDALLEFDAVLRKEPNRFRALAGAMAAAQLAGDKGTAKSVARQLLDLAADADSPRDSLAQAKRLAGV